MDKSLIEDVFEYHAPNTAEIESMELIRSRAKELAYMIIEQCPKSADRSDALRKLREVVMTANASIILKGMV